jgi:hypothetical protein
MGVSLLLKIQTLEILLHLQVYLSSPMDPIQSHFGQTNMIVWTFNLFFLLPCVFLPSLSVQETLQNARSNLKMF